MKRTSIYFLLAIALTCFAATLRPAAAEDADMLEQAEDLVHQAWNPAGDPPSDDQRTQLLTKAIGLAKNAPQHHLHKNRVHAIELLKSALEEIKNGDPDKRVNGYLKDADADLRESISEAT